MQKVRRFKTDDWVIYCPFLDSHYENLKNTKIRSVVLEVLSQKDIYDYRIFLDDGKSRIKKVREKNLIEIT